MRLPNWPIGHVLVQIEDPSSPTGWVLNTIPVEQYVVDAMEEHDPRIQALLAGDAGPLNAYLRRELAGLTRIVIENRSRINGPWPKPDASSDHPTGGGGADLDFADQAEGGAQDEGAEAFASGALIAAHARGGPVHSSTSALREPDPDPGAEGSGAQDGGH